MLSEIHGSNNPSATRLLLIMGLNNSCFGWHNQVRHFGSAEGYAVLVFDNRGVGNSDNPRGPYKTSDMAKDVVELLEYVGWTENRSINVIGISMGGMIAEELALDIPERILSLILNSTSHGNTFDLPSRKGLWMFARLLSGTIRTPEGQVALVVDSLYPTDWLNGDDEKNPGSTRRERMEKEFLYRYHITRRQPYSGRLSQVAAALGHKVSKERFLTISKTIPKVAIMTGDDDNLINPKRSKEIHAFIPGSEFKLVKGGGHALPSQIPEEYNEWVTKVISEAKAEVDSDPRWKVTEEVTSEAS